MLEPLPRPTGVWLRAVRVSVGGCEEVGVTLMRVAEQAMCRSYRFGQQRPVHVYRLVGSGTMERTIFNQQIRKERLLRTVVDERGVARHFTQRYVARQHMRVYSALCSHGALSPAAN